MITVNLTEHDKKLILLTALALLAFSLWYFIVRPLKTMNTELRSLVSASESKCVELSLKADALPGAITDCAAAQANYDNAVKRLYPYMKASDIDAFITGMVFDCGLSVSSFGLAVPDSPSALSPYSYSDIASVWDSGELSGIYTAVISLTVSGSEADLNRLIDRFCDLDSLRITSFIWSMPDANSKSGVCNLKIKLELYMYKLEDDFG